MRCLFSQQDGGSDITQGQSKETTRDAEAHGKYAEKPCGDGRDAMACDAVMSFRMKLISWEKGIKKKKFFIFSIFFCLL